MINKKVLFIEEEETEYILEALSKHGYSVDLSTSCVDGLESLSKNQYDIVLLDIMMSHGEEIPKYILARQTGIEILRMIRNGQIPNVNRGIPIIVITAIGSSYEIGEMRKFNVNQIIQKPVSPDDILSKIDEVLSSLDSKKG
jgi:CheY-like chemotaxis protein